MGVLRLRLLLATGTTKLCVMMSDLKNEPRTKEELDTNIFLTYTIISSRADFIIELDIQASSDKRQRRIPHR